jgi:phosphate acetyltransferase
MRGLVLGMRVPIVLTSRSDSVASRVASCALAVLGRSAVRVGPELGRAA